MLAIFHLQQYFQAEYKSKTLGEIWNEVKKACEIGQRLDRFDIYFCIFFDCYYHSLNSGRETGH